MQSSLPSRKTVDKSSTYSKINIIINCGHSMEREREPIQIRTAVKRNNDSRPSQYALSGNSHKFSVSIHFVYLFKAFRVIGPNCYQCDPALYVAWVLVGHLWIKSLYHLPLAMVSCCGCCFSRWFLTKTALHHKSLIMRLVIMYQCWRHKDIRNSVGVNIRKRICR